MGKTNREGPDTKRSGERGDEREGERTGELKWAHHVPSIVQRRGRTRDGRPFNKGGTKYPSWIDRQCPSFLAHNFRERKEGTQAERRKRTCALSSNSGVRHFSRKAQMLCPNETENEAEMEPACAKASDQIILNANACKCDRHTGEYPRPLARTRQVILEHKKRFIDPYRRVYTTRGFELT